MRSEPTMIQRASKSALELFANEVPQPTPLPRPMIKDPMGRSRRALERNAALGHEGAIRELRELDARRLQ